MKYRVIEDKVYIHPYFCFDPHNFVGDPHIFIRDPQSLGVSNKNLGVSNKNMAVSNEIMGGYFIIYVNKMTRSNTYSLISSTYHDHRLEVQPLFLQQHIPKYKIKFCRLI